MSYRKAARELALKPYGGGIRVAEEANLAHGNIDTHGRARGVHPLGWISAKCAKLEHRRCSQLSCSCVCHALQARP